MSVTFLAFSIVALCWKELFDVVRGWNEIGLDGNELNRNGLNDTNG